MLPKKTRHIVYALLLMTFSVVCTSAIAGKKAFSVYEEVASAIKEATSSKTGAVEKTALKNSSITEKKETVSATAAPMFATIIQGYDDVDNCTSDGSTIARFILCGDSDDRNITLWYKFFLGRQQSKCQDQDNQQKSKDTKADKEKID